VAAAGASDTELPLWVYALGLAALVILSIAATLYVQTQRPAVTKLPAEEFEIQ
jgi:hypothetical protein